MSVCGNLASSPIVSFFSLSGIRLQQTHAMTFARLAVDASSRDSSPLKPTWTSLACSLLLTKTCGQTGETLLGTNTQEPVLSLFSESRNIRRSITRRKSNVAVVDRCIFLISLHRLGPGWLGTRSSRIHPKPETVRVESSTAARLHCVGSHRHWPGIHN